MTSSNGAASLAPNASNLTQSKPSVDEVVELFRDHLVGQPVGELLSTQDKGEAGRMLQELLGIAHDGRALDLSDGELKTVQVKVVEDEDGNLVRTQETIAVSQLPRELDRADDGNVIERILGKLSNTVIVEHLVFPDGRRVWGSVFRIDARRDIQLMFALTLDYNNLITSLRTDAKLLGQLHTRSASLMQVRTKDQKPYTAMTLDGAQVSDKRRALYLLGSFLQVLQERFPETVVAAHRLPSATPDLFDPDMILQSLDYSQPALLPA